MAKVIIFGLMDLAELAHYYLTEDSEHEIVAFTVHKKFRTIETFKGLAVVEFETIEEKYPNTVYQLFAPMIGTDMNRLREDVYNEGKKKGYKFISYISSKATLFNNKIGENCFVLENVIIQPFVKIGNNVIIWSGSLIAHHSVIEDHIFIASSAIISGNCLLQSNCTVGANASIREGIRLAKGTFVGMSAAVVSDTIGWSLYIGVPALKIQKSFNKDL